jgi:hypothetical protein
MCCSPRYCSLCLNCLSLGCHVAVTDSDNTLPRQLSPDVLSALQGVRFIAQHIKDADKDNEVSTSIWCMHNFHLDYCLYIRRFCDNDIAAITTASEGYKRPCFLLSAIIEPTRMGLLTYLLELNPLLWNRLDLV